MYELPAEPVSGIGVDRYGITWRRNAAGLYDAACCTHCQQRPGGSLTWIQVLERGPLTDPPAVEGEPL